MPAPAASIMSLLPTPTSATWVATRQCEPCTPACFMAHRIDRGWIEDIEKVIRENYSQFDADHGTSADPKVYDWIRSQARGTGIDVELLGGERVRLGRDWWLEIVHTPGHTRGRVSVIDPRATL